MATTGFRDDPVRGFNFHISLIKSAGILQKAIFGTEPIAAGGFSECSGLEANMTVEDYLEGGVNNYVHKFMTRMTYANIVLKRGMSFSSELWQWHADFINGNGKRMDGLIVLQNELGLPVKAWKFVRGLPMKMTGPTLNAAQGAVAIETLEIVHEGWTYQGI
jgi:phage tail-like protein